MDSAFKAYLGYLRASGVPFKIAPDLTRDPDHNSTLLPEGERPRVHRDLWDQPVLEVDAPESALGSDHATLSVAHELGRIGNDLAGARFLDLGCGTGLLVVCAALYGARVVGTDIDPEAIRLCRANAQLNGVEIDLRLGHLTEPIHGRETFDLIVTNLPHKPHPPEADLPLGQAGGAHGDRLWRQVAEPLKHHMPPGSRLLYFLHSLPHPRLLLRVAEDFDLTVRRWKLRWLQPGEYGELHEEFERRHRQGQSFLWHVGDRVALVGCVWDGRRRGAVS